MSVSMPTDEDKEPLSVETILAALRKAWPSIEPEVVTFVTGSTVKATIWQFVVGITLTTTPVIHSAKAGQARMTFVFHPHTLRPVQLKTDTTDELVVVKAFIRACKMYLNGVVSAIERAGEEPPPAPESSIFQIR